MKTTSVVDARPNSGTQLLPTEFNSGQQTSKFGNTKTLKLDGNDDLSRSGEQEVFDIFKKYEENQKMD